MLVEQDLNCNSTIKSIVNYYCGLSDRCLQHTIGCKKYIAVDEESDGMDDPALQQKNPWAAAGWDASEWPTPWMQSLGPILRGDGAPIF